MGFATVGVFATWYTRSSFLGIDLSGDGHTPLTMAQLRSWESCPTWEGFKVGVGAGGRMVRGRAGRRLRRAGLLLVDVLQER